MMRNVMQGIWSIVLEARADNVTGEAAKIAYYFFLSLWPLLLGIFAFAGIFGGEPAFEWIMGWVREAIPSEANRIVQRYVESVVAERRPDMLSLGIILTLWSGSNIFATLAEGLNVMYDLDEGRSWWKRRVMSLGLLVAASVLLTGGASALLAGEEIAEAFGIRDAIASLRYPVAFLAVMALLWLVYYYLPARDQNVAKRWVTTGAVVGATLWFLATALFRLYVSHLGGYDSYGIVGAVLVLLLWLYLTALAILLGGEVAVSLEQGLHRSET